MKEWTCWAFNAVALIAIKFVADVPALGFGMVVVCLVLTVVSFRLDRQDPGNPALGFLASLILWTTVYAVVAYPKIVLNDVAYALVYVGGFGGLALFLVWIVRKAWRKREAFEARSNLMDDT